MRLNKKNRRANKMRKLVLILALGLFATLGVSAQTKVQDLFSNAASGVKLTDTITNAGTVTMTSSTVVGTPNQTTVGAVFTKLTGTVAGTASLKGSFNGVDFYVASATTYTVTDLATQNTSWQITGSPYLYYQVSVTGSGTSTYTVKGQVLTRNPK